MDHQRMPFRCIPQPGTKNHFFAQRVLGESMVIVVLGSMGGCFMMFLSPKNAFLHHAKSTLTVHQATFHDRSQTYDLHVYRHAIYMAVDPTKDAKQYGKGRFWRGWSGPYIYTYAYAYMEPPKPLDAKTLLPNWLLLWIGLNHRDITYVYIRVICMCTRAYGNLRRTLWVWVAMNRKNQHSGVTWMLPFAKVL